MYIQPLVICKCSKCLSTTLKYSIRHRHADYMYNTVKVVTCTEESIYDVNACNIHAHIQCTCILEAVGVALFQTRVSINTQCASTSNTVHAGVADRLIQAHTTQCGCTTLGEITKVLASYVTCNMQSEQASTDDPSAACKLVYQARPSPSNSWRWSSLIDLSQQVVLPCSTHMRM